MKQIAVKWLATTAPEIFQVSRREVIN